MSIYESCKTCSVVSAPCLFSFALPTEDSLPRANMAPDTGELVKGHRGPDATASGQHLPCTRICRAHAFLYAAPCIFTFPSFFLINYSRKFRNVDLQGILVFLPLGEH